MAYQVANRTTVVEINTANTNLDGSGTIAEAFNAGGTYGSILHTMRIQTRTITATGGMIRIFIKPGSTWFLLKEVPIPPTTFDNPPYPSFATTLDINLPLATGCRIGVTTEVSNTFTITSFGQDITGFI